MPTAEYATRIRQSKRIVACEELRQMISPGDTVYTVFRFASRSGMTRVHGVYIMAKDGNEVAPRNITRLVSDATSLRLVNKPDGFGVDIGMGGGVNIVMDLSRVLFGDDYQLKDRSL